MKFRQYLKEDSEKREKDILGKIYRDCKKYLSDIKYDVETYKLFRGINSTKLLVKKNVRKNRKPKDTPIAWQKVIDEVFKKHNLPLRSQSIFVTNSMSVASEYGEVYDIFPIGNYRVSYNTKYPDLWADFLYPKRHFFDEKLSNKNERNSFKKLIEKEIVPYQKITSVKKIIENAIEGVEIMIECSSYYGLLDDYLEDELPPLESKKDWDKMIKG